MPATFCAATVFVDDSDNLQGPEGPMDSVRR
ncbi:uncharacterized protein METZ01_LOCUS193677 [marine metagenome]|uniref:Uncharacterized protein n=1 Tax=marine metagenome TaxID=408172 RepID=A0A382DT41_9ZZZZ